MKAHATFVTKAARSDSFGAGVGSGPKQPNSAEKSEKTCLLMKCPQAGCDAIALVCHQSLSDVAASMAILYGGSGRETTPQMTVFLRENSS